MSRLYPARRIPQGMILIGAFFVIMSLTIAIGHFGFGVPVYDRDAGQPSSDFEVAILLVVFGGTGLLLVLTGRAVLRAVERHRRGQTAEGNGS